MTDVRERHREVVGERTGPTGYCACSQPFPCDAIQQADEADAARDDAAGWRAEAERISDKYHEAKADRDWLYEICRRTETLAHESEVLAAALRVRQAIAGALLADPEGEDDE